MVKTLSITLNPTLFHLFYPLLQQGVIIKTQVGRSIKDLLFQTLGITPEYMEGKIQTVFLDGKAVDDLNSAIIHDGSTLALSGALPGLVGATFRRKGTYASLRRAITLLEDEKTTPQKEGRVILKLFNLLVPELGPHLLAQGVWISGEHLDQFLKGPHQEFWKGCETVRVDDHEIDWMKLREIKWSPNEDPILFKVTLPSPRNRRS